MGTDKAVSGRHPDEGKRVKLAHCDDEYTRLRPGQEGTIRMVDDEGTYHIDWDDGSKLGLIPGHDRWVVLP